MPAATPAGPPAAVPRPGPAPLLALALLVGVLGFAYDVMHGQIARNGYVDALREVVRAATGAGEGGAKAGPVLLPGTDRPVLSRYVGVERLDRLLVIGNIIFANVADGSRPEMSLYALQFLGQLVPAMLVLLVEGQRVASRRNVLRGAIFWGLAVQALGFGIVMPVYCILHLLLAPADPSAARLRDHVRLRAAPAAFIPGFVLPSALLAYPFADPAVRQWANAVWQVFPLHVVACTVLFAAAAKRVSIGLYGGVAGARLDREALGGAYRFAVVVGALTQWAVYAVLVAAAFRPDVLPEGLAASLTPGKVFVPESLHSFEPMASPAAAIHDLLLYDQLAGGAALLVWAATLAARAGELSIGLSTVIGIARNSVLVGPVGAAVLLLWQRDDALLEAAEADK